MAIILCPGCGENNIDTDVQKVCVNCTIDNNKVPDYKVEKIDVGKRTFNLITFDLNGTKD